MGGRGSSNPSGGGSNSRKLTRALKSVEDRIRGNPTESAILLDDDGTILFDTTDGKGQEVNISADQVRMGEGKTLTHNHPHGYNFSPEDINTAIFMGLKELRATTPDGRAYVLTRTENDKTKNRGLLSAYKRAIRDTTPEIANKYWDYSLSTSENSSRCMIEHTKVLNKWLADHATEYGYKFREEGKKQ